MSLTIADIPREGNDHLHIILSDAHKYECSLVRTRKGLWIVAENGVNLLKTMSESDAVAKFIQILADKEKVNAA